jgi:hypothetical protein
MVGDGTKRVCGGCDTAVHDLDAMGPAGAEALLGSTDGPLCVRKRLSVTSFRPGPASRRVVLAGLAAALATAGIGCAGGASRKQAGTSVDPVEEPVVARTLSPDLGTDESERVRGAEAREYLRELGWTDREITGEAFAHRKRMQEPEHEVPDPATEEGQLYVLLEAVAAFEFGEKDEFPTGRWGTGVFIGRRK